MAAARRKGGETLPPASDDARGREMYALFLDGDYSNAQSAAQAILAKKPNDALALAVLSEVSAALSDTTAVEAVPLPGGVAADVPAAHVPTALVPAAAPTEAMIELDSDELEDERTFLTPVPHSGVAATQLDEITTVDTLDPPLSAARPKAATGNERAVAIAIAVEERATRPTVRPPTHDEDMLAISWGSAIDTVRVHDQAFDRKRLYETYLASDFKAALELAEDLLGRRPDDAMAIAIKSECAAALELRSSVPVPSPNAEIAMAELDARSRALFAKVDGATTVEALAASSDMPEGDAIRLLETLLARGLLRLAPGPILSI